MKQSVLVPSQMNPRSASSHSRSELVVAVALPGQIFIFNPGTFDD